MNPILCIPRTKMLLFERMLRSRSWTVSGSAAAAAAAAALAVGGGGCGAGAACGCWPRCSSRCRSSSSIVLKACNCGTESRAIRCERSDCDGKIHSQRTRVVSKRCRLLVRIRLCTRSMEPIKVITQPSWARRFPLPFWIEKAIDQVVKPTEIQ